MAIRVLRQAILLTLPVLGATTLAAQGPWARATLPTACYGEQDGYAEVQEQAKTDLEAERSRRTAVNKGLHDQIFALDPATLQQRLMAAVQKNPAQAQEIMAAVQQQGTQASVDANVASSKEQIAFEQRKDDLLTAYKTERDATLGPILARIKKHTQEKGGTAEDAAIVRAGVAEYNSKYETVLCPKWFNREIPALMGQYKTLQVEELPKAAAAEASSKRVLDLFGVSSSEYQPTAEISAVVAYLRFAINLYRERQGAPMAPR